MVEDQQMERPENPKRIRRSDLSAYFKLAQDSAGRGRVVIYLIVIASTVGFVVAAQTGVLGWEDARLDLAECGVQYWDYRNKNGDRDLTDDVAIANWTIDSNDKSRPDESKPLMPAESPVAMSTPAATSTPIMTSSSVAASTSAPAQGTNPPAAPVSIQTAVNTASAPKKTSSVKTIERAKSPPSDDQLEKSKKMDLEIKLDRLKRGKRVTEVRKLRDSEMAREHLDEIRKSFVNNILVKTIPIIGITIDVNLIGPLTCLILLILLVMFRITLSKDLEILRIIKDLSKDADPALIRECYYRLSLAHVTVRPPSQFTPVRKGFWTVIPKIIAFIPFLVVTFVFVNDLSTSPRGMFLDPRLMGITAAIEGLFWLLAAVLTWNIVEVELRDIDATWEKWSEFVFTGNGTVS